MSVLCFVFVSLTSLMLGYCIICHASNWCLCILYKYRHKLFHDVKLPVSFIVQSLCLFPRADLPAAYFAICETVREAL